jgi:hypothetical protein
MSIVCHTCHTHRWGRAGIEKARAQGEARRGHGQEERSAEIKGTGERSIKYILRSIKYILRSGTVACVCGKEKKRECARLYGREGERRERFGDDKRWRQTAVPVGCALERGEREIARER